MPRASRIIVPLALALPLAACGGGDGSSSVASVPGPVTPSPTPTPSSTGSTNIVRTVIEAPATTDGTFGTVALVENVTASGQHSYRQTASPDEVHIALQDGTYTMTFNAADIPVQSASYKFPIEQVQFGSDAPVDMSFGEIIRHYNAYNSNDGTAVYDEGIASKSATSTTWDGLTYYTGLRYVSFGIWQESPYNSGGSPETKVYFLDGDRTAAADIPASGTASYSGYVSPTEELEVSLTADFATRDISATVDRELGASAGDSSSDSNWDVGVHATGSGTFTSAGDIAIPLTGNTSTYAPVNTDPPVETPVSGSFNGAFFGPGAEQVGGTIYLSSGSGGGIADVWAGTRN